MYLKSVALRDWKAYNTARFDFPAPKRNKNIVLIGAENGFGKTSLFEAIVLGLFGRDGLPLIARSPFSGAGEERLATNYRTFLEKALRKGAIAEGKESCSVTLVFDDEEEGEIELQRIWYFNESGNFKASDEEIRIHEGPNKKLVGPRGLTGSDKQDWYRDYVAKSFLPYYLAAFFMFDGEQVSAFAEREMSAQVAQGIEGLLGIPVLRELAEDLRNYARSRRQQTSSVSDQTLNKIEADRDELKLQHDRSLKRIAEIEPQLHNASDERDRITRELAGYGAGTQAQLEEQIKRLNQHRNEAESAREQLSEALSGDLALSLAGKKIRSETIKRLNAENTRENWESGKRQGDQNLNRFLDRLREELGSLAPPLQGNQTSDVLDRASTSWAALWYPPPENTADTYWHDYLSNVERSKVADRLDALSRLTAPYMIEILDAISSNEAAAIRLQEELTRTSTISPQLDAKRERLRVLNAEIETHNRQLGGLRNEQQGLSAQIGKLNQEIARLGSQMDQAQ